MGSNVTGEVKMVEESTEATERPAEAAEEHSEQTVPDAEATDIFDAESDSSISDDTSAADSAVEKVENDAAAAAQAEKDAAAETEAKAEQEAADAAAAEKKTEEKKAETKAVQVQEFSGIDDEAITGIADSVFEELKDVKIADVDEEGNDTEISLEEWNEKYPGISQVLKLISGKIAQKATGSIVPALKPISGYIADQAFSKAAEKTYKSLADLGHTDAKDIYASDEFNEWADKQSEEIQALFESFDPATVASGLSIYKTANNISTLDAKTAEQKEAEAAAVEKAQKKQAKKDDIHKHSSRTGTPKATVDPGAELSEEEAQAAFEEESNRKEDDDV